MPKFKLSHEEEDGFNIDNFVCIAYYAVLDYQKSCTFFQKGITMKKTSLALIVAITAFSSMAANAVEGEVAGTGTAASTSTGVIVAGSVAAAAAIAGAVVISNSSDGNPITNTGTGTGTTTGTGN